MADFTKFGEGTPRVVVYKSESHKLHQAFPVKSGEKIEQGQPVVINTDGTIQAFKADSKYATYLGIAITDSVNPAYKENRQASVEVTVSAIGHIIVNGVAKAALSAGPVKPTGAMDTTGRFTEYAAVEAASTEPVHFIALNEATDAGELIQILAI